MGGPVADVFQVALHLLTGSTALAGFVLHVRGDAVSTELLGDTGNTPHQRSSTQTYHDEPARRTLALMAPLHAPMLAACKGLRMGK